MSLLCHVPDDRCSSWAQVMASFLEIYGEDIFDLLEEADDGSVRSINQSY
jgi:hypothetical protein